MWNNSEAMRRLTKWLLFLVVIMLIGTVIAWVYNSPRFPVKQVSIAGKLTYSDGKELQDIALSHMSGNIFRADLNGAQEAFQKMPWIDSALVRRRLPDTVEIVLEERIPVARWENSGLVDSKGNVFQATVEGNYPTFEGQMGMGKEMVQHYNEFTKILGPQHLGLKKLIYTARSAWSVILENGITVRLGRENEIQRLQRFVEVWPSLLQKHKNHLVYVDMRYKDGFAVRYNESSTEPAETSSDTEKTSAK